MTKKKTGKFGALVLSFLLVISLFAVQANEVRAEGIAVEKSMDVEAAVAVEESDETTTPVISEEEVTEVGEASTVEPDRVKSLGGITQTSLVLGSEVTVDTVADLVDTIQGAEMDKIIHLGSGFPTVLPDVITISYGKTFNITIDGGGLELKPADNKKHMDIRNTSTGTITFKSIDFKGLREDSKVGGGLVITNSVGGKVTIADSTFTQINSTSGAVALNSGASNILIEETTFDNNLNTSSGGGAIRADSPNGVTIKNSSFKQNHSEWMNYGGGAIFTVGNRGAFVIEKSVFIENTDALRGGAIAFHNGANGSYRVSDSYFEGNKNLRPDWDWADGGAIYMLSSEGAASSILIENSSFIKNSSQDDGGAVIIENPGAAKDNRIVNSTFYQNEAHGLGHYFGNGDYSGGAVQVSRNTTINIENNTMVDNVVYGTNTYIPDGQKGGAIGIHAGSQGNDYKYPTVALKNNILIDNKVMDTAGDLIPDFPYANVYVPENGLIDNGGNIGLDNGVLSTTTVAEVFGSSSVALKDNYIDEANKSIGASNASYSYKLKTLPIAPNTGTIGIANSTGSATTVAEDLRGFSRNATTPDVGAVETTWIKYDANGENWQLPAMTEYDGDAYYVGTEPTTYYQVAYINKDDGIKDPVDLTIPDGLVFSHWNTASDGNGTSYAPNDPITMNAELTLYAQWQRADVSYTVTYDANEGINPPSPATFEDQTLVTVSGVASMTRQGYTFVAWNTEPDGGGTTYNANEQFTLTGDVVLYAQWLLGDNPVDPTDPNKPGTDVGQNSTNTVNGSKLPQTGGYSLYVLGGILLLAGAVFMTRKIRKNK